MAENPPASVPGGADLPPPPPPPPSGEQPEKTPRSKNKRFPTPALIGAAVAALAAIGIGATWIFGGSESVIRGANIIPGIDIGEPELQVAAEKTTYLTELSGEQPPIPLVAGAGNGLYGNVDPHSPHVFGQEVYRLEGTRFKALERPENLPDTYPRQIRHGYALISGSDQGESEEWFVWDLEAGTAEQFPMPEGTNWLQLVNPDLFLAAQIPPGQKTARFTAVDRNGNELWSKVPAALGLEESCARLPDIHPSGDYLSFSGCFTIVDAKSGTPITTW